VNGLNILELDRDQLLPGAERTAEYLPNGVDHRTPLSASGESAGVLAEQTAATSSSMLTFPSRAAFLGLPQMRAYLDLSLRLAFRTRESTGLLLYNAGRRSDFLALELADGHLHLVASIGGRIVELKDNYPEGVNDNQWHVLVVARTGKDGQCALTTFLSRALLYLSPFPHPYITFILIANKPIFQITYSYSFVNFLQARICWLLLCLCRSFFFFERRLDSNPESCRSRQAR
jgi:hypothetical protein